MTKYLARTALFLLSTLVGASSQNLPVSGTQLAGVVTDPTGATLPDARVLVINLQTLDTQRTVVGGDGKFMFPEKIPGEYAVIVVGSDKPYSPPCWKPAIRQVRVVSGTATDIRIPLLMDLEKCPKVVD